MSLSFAQTTEVTCSACSHAFPFEVWRIIAAEERPDLVERIRAGALHTLTCLQCGQTFDGLDEPLLLYRPAADQPILFSPAQQTTNEQDQQQAADLLRMLRDQLGEQWRDEWLAQGLSDVQRTMLPVAMAMADDREAALYELRERDPVAFVQIWVTLHVRLGISLAQNPLGNRAENLEQAIAAYQQALAMQPREAMPFAWAQTTMNLALAYAARIRGERADNLEQAIRAYEQALAVFRPDLLPNDCRRTARSLGNAYADLGRWCEATTAYDQAVQTAEILYLASASQVGKTAELEANNGKPILLIIPSRHHVMSP